MGIVYQVGPWELGPLTWGAHEQLRVMGSAYVCEVEVDDWRSEVIAAMSITTGASAREVKRKLSKDVIQAWSAWWDEQTKIPEFKAASGVPYARLPIAYEYAARQAGIPVDDETPFQTIIQAAFAHWAEKGYVRLLTQLDKDTESELARLRKVFDEQYGQQG